MPIPWAVCDRDGRRGCRKDRKERLQSENGNHGGEFDVEDEKTGRVERAKRVERKLSTKKAVPEFRLSFGKAALQLARIEARQKVETIAQLVSRASIEAGELRRHVKRTGECKRLLEDSKDEALAVEGSAKETVQIESSFSVTGAVLYRENVFAVLRK